MKMVNGRIVETTEEELFDYYYQRELYEVYEFPNYLQRMRDLGVKILEEKRSSRYEAVSK